MKITCFEDIDGWRASRKLNQVLLESLRTSRFSGDRHLVRQIRKCPISAMANIVEGFDAGSNREFIRFLRIAYRSVTEFQSHLYAGLDARCLDQSTFENLYSTAQEAKASIGGFIRYLKKHVNRTANA